MKFIELLKTGRTKPEDIDDYIGRWHDEYNGDETLEEYLGMTERQYNEWVDDPHSIDRLYCCDRQCEMTVAKQLVDIARDMIER